MRARIFATRPEKFLTAALLGLVAAALALVVGAASRPSPLVPARKGGFSDWLRGPLDLGLSIRPSGFVVLLLVMCACYVCVLIWADRVPVRVGLASVVALHLIFLLAPPLLSTDIFNYVDYARLGVVHHLNPYQHTPGAAPHDAAYGYVAWRNATTVYGPLFTLASYPLGGLSLPAAIWTAKAVTAAAGLGCVGMVWAVARRLERPPLPAAMFVGLNPVLLVWGIGGGHNDVLMMLLALCGIYLSLAQRELGGAMAVAAASAVKLSAGVVLPFMVLGARRPLRAVIGAVAGAAALAVLAFAVFGSHATSFLRVLAAQQDHGSLHSVPKAFADTFGIDATVAAMRPFTTAVFVIALGFLLVRARRGVDWVTAAGWATLALLLATTWFLPWYVVWLLPLAGLSRSRPLRFATLGLGAFAIAMRIPLWLT
jgi:Glycosyltransferase family 87